MIPDPEERPTMSIEDAGRELGLGRSAAYEAASRGEIPTISFGRRKVVPTASLRRLLALDDPQPQELPQRVVIPFQDPRRFNTR